jgi:hypothetical protein
MMGIRFVAIAIATTLATSGVAAAQVSDATVDQVLATLAEVVKDRGKQVASEAIKGQLVKGLCKGSGLKVHTKVREVDLKLGGSKTCQDDRGQCHPDDVFPESCRLMKNDDTVSLTDTHLLKLLGRETTAFAIRLAAADLDEESFKEQKLATLADYLFDLMLDMGKSTPNVDAISQRTLRFAQDFGDSSLPKSVLDKVRALPELKKLCESLGTIKMDEGVCRDSQACRELATKWPPAPKADCDVATLSRKHKVAQDAFAELFGKEKAFELNRSLPCDKQPGCDAAQLLVRLEPQLHRHSCPSGGLAFQEDLRSLAYLVSERQVYINAADALGKTSAKRAAEEFFTSVQSLKIPNLRREQIARAVRVVAYALGAYAHDASKTAKWLGDLKDDLTQINLDTSPSFDSLESLRRENRDKLDSRVRLLRDATKDLLALSLLDYYITGAAGALAGLQDVISGLMNVVDTLVYAAASKPSAEQAIRLIADIVSSLANVGQGAELPPAVLTDTTELLENASDRDWVALAFKISKAVDDQKAASLPGEARRSIHFVRVLLSMYQAQSSDEAKGIFEAELENLSSRRERWNRFSVDAGALLGAAVGGLWDSTTTNTDGAFGYGLFAPFGVQFAWPCFGLMLYPVDLGAYLVGRKDTQTTPAPNWHDSLRAGGAAYFRPSAKIPVDFGVDFDYHPRFSDRAEKRLLGVVVLELPLYVIR